MTMKRGDGLRWAVIGLCAVLAVGCKDKPAVRAPDKLALRGPAELFGPIEHVTLDATIEDTAKLVPTFQRTDDNQLPHLVSEDPQVGSFSLSFADNRLALVKVQLPHRSLAELTAAWGPGRPGDKRQVIYVDKAQRIRASVWSNLDGITILYVPMMSVAALLGDSPAITLAGVALLGRPVKDVDAELGRQRFTVKVEDTKHYVRWLPHTEWGDEPSIDLTAGPDGTVIAAEFVVGMEELGGQDAILAVLDKKFGPHKTTPAPTEAGDMMTYTVGGKALEVHATPSPATCGGWPGSSVAVDRACRGETLCRGGPGCRPGWACGSEACGD